MVMRLALTLVLLMTTTTFSEGKVIALGPVHSQSLGGSRSIQVYLPPSYDVETRRRYPVLYVHDGQNVFGSAGPDCCFGWGNWALDRTADRLMEEGRMREIIIVAVESNRSRYREYRGLLHSAKPRARSRTSESAEGPDNTSFEAYARFLSQELKPRVDEEFRTLKTPAHTGVLGSSLGGICSLSLAWERPRTFGLAASLSGSFQIEKTNFLRRALGEFQGKRKPLRIYLDSGVTDYTGDDDGRKLTDAVAEELRRIGWKDGRDLEHFTDEHLLNEPELEQAGLRRDKWSEARTSQHNEFYWRLRVWRPLVFLFPPEPADTVRGGRAKP